MDYILPQTNKGFISKMKSTLFRFWLNQNHTETISNLLRWFFVLSLVYV